MEVSEAARQRLMHLVRQREAPRAAAAGCDEGRLYPRLVPVTRSGLLGVALDRARDDDQAIPLGAGELLLVAPGLARAMSGFLLDADGDCLRLQPRAPRRPVPASPQPIAPAPAPGADGAVRGRPAAHAPAARLPAAGEPAAAGLGSDAR